MPTIAVYMIADEISKKFYIGSTGDLKRRLQEHKYELKAQTHHNKKLQELYDSGVKLKIHPIKIETIEKAKELEDFLLKQNTNNPNMLNVSIDSTGGNGINRNPNREDIVNRIKNGKIENWKNKSEEEKAIITQKVKEATNTPEAREKRSIGFRAYYDSLTPEQRKQSPETIEKRRKSLIGLKRTDETKAKMTLAHTGKKASDSAKANISLGKKEWYKNNKPYVRTPETLRKLSLSNSGKKMSEETKAKISANKKEWHANRSPEERKLTEEAKLKISLKNKGRVISEERRKEMSIAQKKFLNSMSAEELKKYRDNLYGSRKRKNVISPDL